MMIETFEDIIAEEKWWDAYADAIDAMAEAERANEPRCGNCRNLCRANPKHYPDMDADTLEGIGWCRVLEDFMRADDRVVETECEDFEWR